MKDDSSSGKGYCDSINERHTHTHTPDTHACAALSLSLYPALTHAHFTQLLFARLIAPCTRPHVAAARPEVGDNPPPPTPTPSPPKKKGSTHHGHMCGGTTLPGIHTCLALIRRGDSKAVLETLNAVKSRVSLTSSPPPVGVDYCRAMCFLAADRRGRDVGVHGVLNARQAVLEELRWHPTHLPSRELLFELNEVARPALLPPENVRREEPLFYMLADGLLDHTMLTWPRLYRLFHSVRSVCNTDAQSSRGHVVECGCAGGGASVLMAVALSEFDAHGGRCVFALDSFSGMPPPTACDEVHTTDGDGDVKRSWSTGTCSAPEIAVVNLAQKFGVAQRLKAIRGDLRASIPEALLQDAQIRDAGVDVLHVDVDWYESVKCALDHLLPVMRSSVEECSSSSSSRRVVQVDDYHYWSGARRAVDAALKNWHQPRCGVAPVKMEASRPPTLHEIDGNAVYFHV